MQGGRYTQRSAKLRKLPGVYWHNQTQTQVSKAEIHTIISCFLTIPNISILSICKAGSCWSSNWIKSCLHKRIKGNKYLALLILVAFAAPRSWDTSAQLRWTQSWSYAVLLQFITSEKTNHILNLPVRSLPKREKKKPNKKNQLRKKAQLQIWILSFYILPPRAKGPRTVTAFRSLGTKYYKALLNLTLHMSKSATQGTVPTQYSLT